ncbi:hypothetical protein [Salinimonas chungwhensis]|uniref:hypothetical protein n=1 Tax=Salinimonas chungwhensis TaxID=265425 RepID=UPI0003A64334|nr:hypothetical protein [Salinimonas chungwhensis]
MNATKLMLASLISTSLFATSSIAQETNTNSVPVATSQVSTTWMTLTGSVTRTDQQSVTVDFGEGEITVETDALMLDERAFEKLQGASVTVTGMLNQNLLENGKMRAASLYMQDIGTAFIASESVENESDMLISAAGVDLDKAQVTLIGNVSGVTDDTFQFDVGDGTLNIEVDDLKDNPLDDEGYLQLKHGDRVKITTSLEDDFFEDYEVNAESVVRLQQAK